MLVNWKWSGEESAMGKGQGVMRASAGAEPSETTFVTSVSSMPRPLLGAETVVTGRLSFTLPTRIDGTLRGEVRASELLVIGEEGFVHGTVRAKHLVVLGKMDGDVRGAEWVEVGPTGRFTGTVETRSLVVQEGGKFDGDCRIQPARAKILAFQPLPGTDKPSGLIG